MTDSKNNITEQRTLDEQNIASDTLPNEEMLIPVKFNKEIKNIPLQRATELAQKGMKFEMIEENYEILKSLALAENKSVSEFLQSLKAEKAEIRKSQLIEKCGGDEELALHILELENASVKDNGRFDEVEKFFPNIKTADMLPTEVLERSRLNNTKLLDEYLRYLLIEKLKRKRADAQTFKADQSSLGSLQNKNGAVDIEAVEFLKGLWK